MDIVELIIIAIGVSMDAFAVSICKGISVPQLKPVHLLKAAVWFGGFQALMPLIGYFVGSGFSEFVSSVDHWIAFVLLGIIGINMIREASDKSGDCGKDPDFSFRTMLAMAVATSIDALAVGVTFAFLQVNIFVAVLIIGVMTACFSAAGIKIGNRFGSRFKSRAELLGGCLLIVMGLKILLDHTLFA